MLKPDFRTGKAPPNKGKEYPPSPLDRAEVMALLGATPKHGPRGKRDRALIGLLYGTGSRIGETLQLRESDLNWTTRAITFRSQTTKSRKTRQVGCPPEAWSLLEVWVAERRWLGISGHRPLFCTVVGAEKGRQLQRSVWTTSLHRLAKRAGLERRVTSHQFRHTWTFEYVVKEKGSMLLAQKQLGHARIDTTVRYADHVSPRELIEVSGQRRWNGQGEPPDLSAVLAALAQPGVAEQLQLLLTQGQPPA